MNKKMLITGRINQFDAFKLVLFQVIVVHFNFGLMSQVIFQPEKIESYDSLSRLYMPFSSMSENYDNEVIFFKWGNGNIRIINFNYKESDSTETEWKIMKFHPNGNVSLIVSNCKLHEIIKEGKVLYFFSGSYSTYYKSGKLRSTYNMNFKGCHGEYLFFNENGKLLFKNVYLDGELINGQKFDYISENDFDLVRYERIKDGKVKNSKIINLRTKRSIGFLGKFCFRRISKKFVFEIY